MPVLLIGGMVVPQLRKATLNHPLLQANTEGISSWQILLISRDMFCGRVHTCNPSTIALTVTLQQCLLYWIQQAHVTFDTFLCKRPRDTQSNNGRRVHIRLGMVTPCHKCQRSFNTSRQFASFIHESSSILTGRSTRIVVMKKGGIARV